MSEIITVPLKKGSDVDLVTPLTKWVTSKYTSDEETIKSASEAISKLNKMRKDTIETIERKDQALLANANYFDQLSLLQDRINFKDLQINFKWKNAFEKGRKSALNKGKLSLTLTSLEMKNVRFCSTLEL